MNNSFLYRDYSMKSVMEENLGMIITAVGLLEIPPNKKSVRNIQSNSDFHAHSHVGRIFSEFRLVYVTQGEGVFRSRSVEETKVEEGSFFVVFPDEWQIYQPKPEIGWCAYWVGLKGYNLDKLMKANSFSKENPIISIGLNEKVVSLFQEMLDYSKSDILAHQQSLMGTVTYILSQVFAINQNRQADTNSENRIIMKAKIMMRENICKQLSAEDVAHSLNMSYSLFRRLFKQYTGLAPGQYQQHLRLQKAKELLTISSKNIKEISFTLNFESDYYFSTYFKNKTGQTPSQFRKTLLNKDS